MTLLSPMAAIAAAAIGVPVLLAFYLLKLRRRPVRISSTMLWEQAVRDVQVNVPFRWLRPSWLLLLHLLILALLVLAIGRPALNAGAATADRVVLVIDRSASMNAADAPGGRTRLAHALARAGDLADEMARSGSPEFTVVAFAASPVVAGRPTSNPAEVRRQLASITPTDQPGDAPQAFALVASMAATADEGEAPAPPLVVLLSDGGGTSTPLDLPGAEFRFERAGPPPGAPGQNAGIVALSGARDREDPSLARVYAGLLNASPEPLGVPLALRINGQEVSRIAVRLPGSGDDARAGEAGHTFEFRQPGACLVEVRILHNDALPGDNTAALTLAPARLPAVLLVAPGPAGSPEPDPFLADVLAELPLRQLRVVSADTYERFGPDAGAFDAIVFDRVEPLSLPVRPSLSFGASLPGLHPPSHRERAADGPEGHAADEPEGRIQRINRATTAIAGGVTSWERDHPVLRDLTLEPLLVSRPIALPEAPPTGSAWESVRPLAAGVGGPLIVEARARGNAHLAVGFAVADSNWPVHFGFPIFVAAAIEHLAPAAGGAAGASVTTTEPVRISAPAGTRVSLEGPAPASAQAGPGGTAEVGVLPRAGVYRVAGRGPEAAVAVNLLSPEESSLATAESVTVAGRAQPSRGGEAAGPTDLWPWFVLAAFVLLAVEWGVYAMLMRV